jgi:hypothetical protein
MKKWSIYKLVAILTLSTLNKLAAQQIQLLNTTRLKTFPSASSLEFYNGRLYVIGDDAPHILVLDQSHRVIDSIRILSTKDTRIHKDTKADLESSVIITTNGKPLLLAFGSLSTKKRNRIVVVPLNSSRKITHKIFRWNNPELVNLNIEGAGMVGRHLLLSNRANNTSAANHFIVTSLRKRQRISCISKIIKVELPLLKPVIGISGMYYTKENDVLFFTASTEDTNDAYSDGEIGESYIGYIKNISNRLEENTIRVDMLIALSGHLKESSLQKIEGIAIEKTEADYVIAHIAADNDNGESMLFKIRLQMNQP